MASLAQHAHLKPSEQIAIEALVWNYRAFKREDDLRNGLRSVGVQTVEIDQFVDLIRATEID